jgi:hypothetical protein
VFEREVVTVGDVSLFLLMKILPGLEYEDVLPASCQGMIDTGYDRYYGCVQKERGAVVALIRKRIKGFCGPDADARCPYAKQRPPRPAVMCADGRDPFLAVAELANDAGIPFDPTLLSGHYREESLNPLDPGLAELSPMQLSLLRGRHYFVIRQREREDRRHPALDAFVDTGHCEPLTYVIKERLACTDGTDPSTPAYEAAKLAGFVYEPELTSVFMGTAPRSPQDRVLADGGASREVWNVTLRRDEGAGSPSFRVWVDPGTCRILASENTLTPSHPHIEQPEKGH